MGICINPCTSSEFVEVDANNVKQVLVDKESDDKNNEEYAAANKEMKTA